MDENADFHEGPWHGTILESLGHFLWHLFDGTEPNEEESMNALTDYLIRAGLTPLENYVDPGPPPDIDAPEADWSLWRAKVVAYRKAKRSTAGSCVPPTDAPPPEVRSKCAEFSKNKKT